MTKRMFYLSLAIVAIAVSTLPLAAQPAGGRPDFKRMGPPHFQGGPPWMRARAAFQNFDKNGDGSLSKAEVPERAWEFLKFADADKNGQVTRPEVLNHAVTRLVGALDLDNDGKVTKSEVPKPLWERLQAADNDKDEAVTHADIVKTIQAKVSQHQKIGRPAGK